MTNIIRQFEVVKRSIKEGDKYLVPPYIIGSNQLLFFYQGLLCVPGKDFQYTEVGEKGSLSNEIQVEFDFDLNCQVSIFVIN
jgi:hypothetical protein